MLKQRFAKAEFAAWMGIAGNLGLALLKGVAGWLSGSKALLADAFNSASDVAGSIAVLIGLKASQMPPDKDHPYGHGKAEPIAAIIVSVLILVVGLEVGMNAIQTLTSGVSAPPAWYALVAIFFSIIVKEAMFQYKYRLGRKIASHSLVASAWDDRSDVYSSLAALLGVGGALIGQWAGISALYLLDPLAGLFVALLILRTGYRLVMESIHNTMDHVLHDEDASELLETIQSVKGVIAVDDLRAREHGHYVIVDVKISVNPKISVMEGHGIAKAVKQELMRRHEHVTDVLIHVNPYDPGYPYKEADPPGGAASRLLH
mgnify:CR=1 FL=1